MADSLAEQAGQMAVAYGLVAAAAVPVGLACRWAAGADRRPWPRGAVGWNGVDAVLVFAASFAVRGLGTLAVLFVPVFAAGFGWWRRQTAAEPPVLWSWRRAAGDVALAVRTWVWLTPVTFAVYAAATSALAGGNPDKHPLTTADPLTLVLAAGVIAPYFEELGFRRLLVPWAAGQRYRPWLVTAAAAVVPAQQAVNGRGVGPLAVWAGLAAGLYAVNHARRVVPRFPVRTASAVWATAALFALFHSSVWPDPVPLFVLAIGLGWLVARTRGVTAAAVAHALFNAVSAVYVLRGGT
jgi:membrane protease YdiL (CAAX protease family)